MAASVSQTKCRPASAVPVKPSGALKLQGVQPDIVTMAKSIGNGAPLAAVVTTRAIAEKLSSRLHFNTFGGNPVSCAMGMATLEILQKEDFMGKARTIGGQLKAGLEKLAAKYDIIGDVRGRGFMLGVRVREGPRQQRTRFSRMRTGF